MREIIVKLLSVLIVLLGLIHNVATFTPLISGGIEEWKVNSLRYMSLMCGTSLVLSGVLLYLMMPKMDEEKSMIAPVRIVGLFLTFTGVLAVCYMPYNPFAWVTLILCASMCFFIFARRAR